MNKPYCPICKKPVIGKNSWIKYHISYKPEMTIMACKFCNYTEWLLRNNLSMKYHLECIARSKDVILYQNKFGIKI
jgi:hypothetical protein